MCPCHDVLISSIYNKSRMEFVQYHAMCHQTYCLYGLVVEFERPEAEASLEFADGGECEEELFRSTERRVWMLHLRLQNARLLLLRRDHSIQQLLEYDTTETFEYEDHINGLVQERRNHINGLMQERRNSFHFFNALTYTGVSSFLHWRIDISWRIDSRC